MGSPLIQNVDSQTQNSQPVDLSDSDLLLYRDPNLYFHNLADKAFAFVTSQHLFVLNLIVSKLQIIDFTPTGMEIKQFKWNQIFFFKPWKIILTVIKYYLHLLKGITISYFNIR